MKLIKVFGIQKLHWQNLKIVRYSGCLNAKPDVLNTYQAIKSALLSNKEEMNTFMRCGNLTYDPWIWLRLTSMASTASNISQISASHECTNTVFMSQKCIFDA